MAPTATHVMTVNAKNTNANPLRLDPETPGFGSAVTATKSKNDKKIAATSAMAYTAFLSIVFSHAEAGVVENPGRKCPSDKEESKPR